MEGSVDSKEHSAFLNMWLEHFVFCRKAVGSVTHYQRLAEHVAHGNNFALGKHLLGSVYSLLHEVSIRLRTKQHMGNPGSPWWFINLWLNMHMQEMLNKTILAKKFPANQIEEEEENER